MDIQILNNQIIVRWDGNVILNYTDLYTRNLADLNFGFGSRTGGDDDNHYIKGLLVTKLGTNTSQYYVDNVAAPLASGLYWYNATSSANTNTDLGALGIDNADPSATLTVNGTISDTTLVYNTGTVCKVHRLPCEQHRPPVVLIRLVLIFSVPAQTLLQIMVGDQITMPDGTVETIASVASTTELTTTTKESVAEGTYTINTPSFSVNSSGNVGVGTSSAAYQLDVQDNQVATGAARIWNTTTNGTACASAGKCTTDLLLEMGSIGSAATANTSDYFVNFMNSNGVSQGAITGNGSAGVTYNTGGADYAEYYPVDPSTSDADIPTVFPAGTLVCQGTNGVIPCSSPNSPDILGVISQDAGFVGGTQADNTVLVGLLGQIPVNVASTSGAINQGDLITSSSIPGVAQKATGSGQVIGKAMANYNGSGTGQIMVAVSSVFADPNSALSNLNFDANGNLQASSIDLNSPMTIDGQEVTNVEDALNALNDQSTTALTQSASNAAQLTQNNNIVTNLSDDVASMSAEISNFTSNVIAGITSDYTGSSSALTIDSAGDVNTGTLNAQQLNVNGNISAQSLTLNGQDVGASLSALQSNVNGLSSQTNNLDLGLSSLQSDFTSLNTQVATNSAQIDETNSLVSSLNDQLASATAALTTVSNNVSGLLTSIGNNYTGSTSALTINDLAQVGIGTTVPNYELDVQAATSSAVAQIYNESSDATSVGLQIKLGTTSPQATNQFITFLDGNGNTLGSIRGNGTSNTITYDGNGGDFAEYFQKADPNATFNAGELICNSSTGGAEVCGPNSNGILGVLSNDASFVGAGRNENNPDYILVGLIGQLQVQIAPDSPAINSGDPITYSTTYPGEATKATQPGQIVGRALAAYDPNNPTAKILVAINVGWYDPGTALDGNGNLAINGQPMSNSALTLAVTTLTKQNNSLASYEATTSAALTNNTNEISSLKSQVASLSGALANGQFGSGQESSIPVASSEGIFALNNLSSQISELENQLLNINMTNALSSLDATVSGSLNVFGNTTLNNLGVTGTISTGVMTIQGLDQTGQASINTIGDLKLQDQGAGGIDILNGKIKIDTNGNFVSKGEITAKKINIDTSNVLSASLGTLTIHAGQTQAIATTSALTKNSKIFATPEDVPVAVSAQRSGKNTFTIQIASPQSEDLKVNWWIIN